MLTCKNDFTTEWVNPVPSTSFVLDLDVAYALFAFVEGIASRNETNSDSVLSAPYRNDVLAAANTEERDLSGAKGVPVKATLAWVLSGTVAPHSFLKVMTDLLPSGEGMEVNRTMRHSPNLPTA